jgi:3-hydroxy acid dehydrogenase/malonic semialdehyde reductase
MSRMKILITGASAGIGRATAILLARKGHEVFMVARRKAELQKIAAGEASVVGEFQLDYLDVGDAQDVERFAKQHAGWLKDCDVLINNAGLALGREEFQLGDDADVATMIQTNIMGLLNLTRKVIPHMIARKKGHVLNLGSVAGETPYKGGTVYCATKAAVHMITDCLRLDLGGTGVRVSTVAPGRVSTEFSEVRFKGDKARAKTMYEGYRVLSPEDVAASMAWILEQPAHVNIQFLELLSTDQPSATTLEPLKA